MSQKSAPLRQKDLEWSWGQAEDDAFTSLKTAISSTPVLKFFNLEEPVTSSVHASSKGVGANKCPLPYASKSLTLSRQNYAQIEKEMLALVFGCEHFHNYLYGKREITVSRKRPQTVRSNIEVTHSSSTPPSAKDDSQDKALSSQGQVPTW